MADFLSPSCPAPHLVDADAAKVAGIRAFVMKPLTKGEIAKTIRKVLDE